MTHIPDEAVQAAQEEYRNQAKINNWGSSWPSCESMESIVSAAVAHLPKTSVIITEKSIYEAAKRSYEYEGDRKGIYYIGFDNEPDDVQYQWKCSVKEAIDGALPYLSAPCAVEVMKLEWENLSGDFYAKGCGWQYNLYETTPNHWNAVTTSPKNVRLATNSSLEQAKAAAQADFERRILSCVVTKPFDVAAVRKQAFEEALKAIKSIPTPMYVETINGHEDAYRAVEALSPSEPAQCQICNGHGIKDYAGFAMDLCECMSDDAAVDRFANLMKSKLAKKRKEGRSGWQVMSADELTDILRHHVDKGDPVDVANLCMMLSENGQSITSASRAALAQGGE